MACAGVAPASLARRIARHDVPRIRKHGRCIACSPSIPRGLRALLPRISRTAQIARAQDYTQLTIAKLKDDLRARGLPLAGSKAVLVRRLQDNDAEDDASSPADGYSETAQLFPSGGPMPEFSEVTKSELLQELRRRGDPILGRSKIDLYERLQRVLLGLEEPGGPPTPIRDFAGNPTYPVEDESTTSRDKATAYKAARNFVVDPEFNPEATTAIELNSILQALGLPSSGRKAEMIFRLEQFLEGEGVGKNQGGTFGAMSGSRGHLEGRPEEVAQVRAILEQMSDDEVATALKSQGVVVSGDPRSMRERLELMLLVEARAERSESDGNDIELLTEQAREEVCIPARSLSFE